jgi:hypothetical protein
MRERAKKKREGEERGICEEEGRI